MNRNHGLRLSAPHLRARAPDYFLIDRQIKGSSGDRAITEAFKAWALADVWNDLGLADKCTMPNLLERRACKTLIFKYILYMSRAGTANKQRKYKSSY